MDCKNLVKAFSLFLCMALMVSCKNSGDQKTAENPGESATDPGVYKYGLRIDTFLVTEHIIERNQFMADILQGFNVPYSDIHRLATDFKDEFDFRKIRVGQPYTVLRRNDSTSAIEYLIYENNAVDFIVCSFRDSVCIYKGQKEVETCEQMASGIITSSLYETLQESNVSPTLSLLLADVYAWTVDFYHLSRGDKFKVIYEEKFVDNRSIGVSKIKSAIFEHNGREIYAHHYETPEDSLGGEYYDQEGNNLRKAFLKSPLKFGRITSRYTYRRFHPVQKRYKEHLGTDYAAPAGTPILATGDGVVVEAAYKKYNGNYVKIRHNGIYTTQYLHMSGFANGIRPGVHVRQGQVIGYVGSTGLATGPHVCYRFWKNGSQVDPFREELPPSEPIKEEYKDGFMADFNQARQILDGIPYPVPRETPAEPEDLLTENLD